MRIVVDKRIAEDLAAALAKLALKGEKTPQRYIIQVNSEEKTILIANRGVNNEPDGIFPLGVRYHVLMRDVL